jgi:hypothetical protein
MSVSPSVCTKQIGYYWANSHVMRQLSSFRKYVENKVSLKSDQNNGYFSLRQISIFVTSHSILKIENCFRQKLRRKSKQIFMPNNFFLESRCLWNIVEEYCRTVQATD